MAAEPRTLLLLLGVLAALFAWSVWAGLAGVGVIAAWMLWLVAGDAAKKRRWQKECREQLERALAARRLGLEAAFYGAPGSAALGVASGGAVFTAFSREGAEVFDGKAILEARARRLQQGDYEIGLCVPGRVSGRPYWHTVIVEDRDAALRWARRVESLGRLDLQLGE
ncbi:MAG: hypothetical protein WAO95_18725 [Burkholderiales bacterium]